MGITESQDISADALIAKLQDSGVAMLDNNFVSSMLHEAPLCDFESVYGDVTNDKNIVYDTLKENLPASEPMLQTTELAVSNALYKHDLPGLG